MANTHDSRSGAAAPRAWSSPWPFVPAAAGTHGAGAPATVRLLDTSPKPLVLTRRHLFGVAALAWGTALVAGGIGSLGFLRALFPNVVFEPPMKFRTARPATFRADTVDTTWKESNQVWIVNVGGRIIALSTVCTHLGCTPNWLASESKFKCPCHGSGYYMNGVNFEGPAPRPLERYRVYVDPADGFLWVDKTAACRLELGTCDSSRFYVAVA